MGPLKSYVLTQAENSHPLWKSPWKSLFKISEYAFDISRILLRLFFCSLSLVTLPPWSKIKLIILFCVQNCDTPAALMAWTPYATFDRSLLFDQPESSMVKTVLTVHPVNNHAGLRHFSNLLSIMYWGDSPAERIKVSLHNCIKSLNACINEVPYTEKAQFISFLEHNSE